MLPRAVAVCGLGLALLAGPATGVATAGAAPARTVITVRSGSHVVAKLTRPRGAKLDSATTSIPEAAPGVPRTIVLAWTEVRRVSKKVRTWRTYVTWCDTRCDTPKQVASARRRSTGGWNTDVAADGDRALVRYGVQTSPRWTLLQRRRGVLSRGPATAWGDWSTSALARRADGTDWAASSTTSQDAYVVQLQNGALLGATAATKLAAPADSVHLHPFGQGLAATWDQRADPEDGVGRIVWSSGAGSAELADPANQAIVAESGSPAVLAGPSSGPLLLLWVDAEVRGAGVRTAARAGWVSVGGRPDPGSAANFGPRDDARSVQGWITDVVQFADGSVAMCPQQIVAPSLGGPLAPGSQPACPPSWNVDW